MTTAQLPKGVAAILALLNLCLSQESAVKRCRDGEGFGKDERKEWHWLANAIETPVIASQFRELDCETSDYLATLIGQYYTAMHVDPAKQQKKKRKKKNKLMLTLFDEVA